MVSTVIVDTVMVNTAARVSTVIVSTVMVNTAAGSSLAPLRKKCTLINTNRGTETEAQ